MKWLLLCAAGCALSLWRTLSVSEDVTWQEVVRGFNCVLWGVNLGMAVALVRMRS